MCAVLVTSCQKQEKTNINHMIVVYLLVYGINGLGAITLYLNLSELNSLHFLEIKALDEL